MLTHQQINDCSIPMPEGFRGLDSHREVRKFWKNLPHWRQNGATYFVTFRQSDSIPRKIWDKMKEDASWWKNKMTQSDAEITDSLKNQFRTFRKKYAEKLEETLDEGRGSCELRKPEQRETVERALLRFDCDRYDLESYAVMPNHVHVMLRPLGDWSLESILQSWKKYSARRINVERGQEGRFWQPGYHDRIVRGEDHFRNACRYILKNPLKAHIDDEAASVYLKGAFEKRRTDLQIGSRSRSGAVNATGRTFRPKVSAELVAEVDESSASSLRTDQEIGSPFPTAKSKFNS